MHCTKVCQWLAGFLRVIRFKAVIKLTKNSLLLLKVLKALANIPVSGIWLPVVLYTTESNNEETYFQLFFRFGKTWCLICGVIDIQFDNLHRRYSIAIFIRRTPWSGSYVSWIYNYLCNQCLSPLKLWVRTPFMARCTRYSIMWSSLSVTCDRSVVFFRFPPPISKTNRHDITAILLKVALNTITLTIRHVHSQKTRNSNNLTNQRSFFLCL